MAHKPASEDLLQTFRRLGENAADNFKNAIEEKTSAIRVHLDGKLRALQAHRLVEQFVSRERCKAHQIYHFQKQAERAAEDLLRSVPIANMPTIEKVSSNGSASTSRPTTTEAVQCTLASEFQPAEATKDPYGDLWGSTNWHFDPFKLTERDQVGDLEDASDIREGARTVNIFTTACLPWMTGTAVNPLLRAHYLASPQEERHVTLYVPWLSKGDQAIVYPNNITFDTPEQQEEFVRGWVYTRTGEDTKHFNISWYPGRYAPEKGSILPVGDITQWVPSHQADVAVLEEPEHLTWYHHGQRWTDKFRHVVGIMHTNYLDYMRREEHGALKALVLRAVNQWVCRAHCHKVVKLSNAVQQLPRECTQFVHGVSPQFLEVGKEKARAACNLKHSISSEEASSSTPRPDSVWPQGAYFLGKVVWAKGYTELLGLLEQHKAKGHTAVPMDIYGSGADMQEVQDRAKAAELPLSFHGARDHADVSLHSYKVFVNPSLSDVVATSTAEALAMGKFVVCAEHPSNAFFSTFQNCITYRTAEEFSAKLMYALENSPAPMTPSELSRLTWEGATHRFLDSVSLKPTERACLAERLIDNFAAATHNALTGVEMLRVTAGAGSHTLESPQRVVDYIPSSTEVGGLFDNHSRAAAARKASK